jgi:hypothetical protein
MTIFQDHRDGCDCQLCRELQKIARSENSIAHSLKEIVQILKPHFPVRGVISQGEPMLTGTITGLAPGASDIFFCTPVDVNGNPDGLPSGVTGQWSSSDSTVTLVPVASDPTGNSVTATAATGATPGGSFVLTWTANLPSGAITANATVPYLALQPVGGVISQGSPAQSSVAQAAKKQ